MRRNFRIAVAVGAFAAAGAAFHCGSDDGSLFDGPRCSADIECASAQYCDPAGTCRSDCVGPEVTCSACDDRGRCLTGRDADGSTTFDDGSISSDAPGIQPDACVDINLTLAKITPTVVLLVDQSGSMTTAFSGNQDRWTVLRNTLMTTDGGIVKQLEGDVAFGLSMYSWDGKTDASLCPTVTTVGTALGNYGPIFNVYADASPIDNTPTGNAIRKVVGVDNAGNVVPGGLAAMQTPGPKIVILATDGDPDSCESGGKNDQASQVRAVRATQAAYEAGVKTFVIAVGNQITAQNQQEIANAGVGLSPDAGDAAYYRTNNQNELAQALSSIITGVRSCKFALNGTVVKGSEAQGTVTLNGQPLGFDDPNGWRLNSSSELEVLGTACNVVKSSPNAQLTVRFPCGAAVIR